MRVPRTGLVPRQIFVRDAKIFVVAVEGEKTEKQYLSWFQNSRVHVQVLATEPDGKGAPKHVLDRLAKFGEEYDLGPEDELWLMIDVDRQRIEFLEPLTQMAQQSGYRLAVSNPCFELWILLHFADANPEDIKCGAVESRLRQTLGQYNKTRLEAGFFSRQSVVDAIARAKVLDQSDNTRWPARPGTRVYQLVEKLLEYVPISSVSISQ